MVVSGLRSGRIHATTAVGGAHAGAGCGGVSQAFSTASVVLGPSSAAYNNP